jgi:hypothetical protein
VPERLRPSQTGGGVLIETSNPQPEIRKNAETAKDWEYREEAAFLYRWAVTFKERLLDPIARTDRDRLPDPVIGFEPMRIEILAAYTLARNPQGLLYEITFNARHLDRPQWEQLETLLHEQVHLWQQNFGENPIKPGRAYHNREFVEKCESLGLHPRPGVGAHWKPADGVFELLMREHGISRPEYAEVEEGQRSNWWDLGKERKGSSTLSKWSCGCQNVRVGTKEFYACCLRCGNLFVRVESGAQLTGAGPSQRQDDADAADQRMSWQDHEEGIYQPRIHSARIRELHQLAVLSGEPMTTLVDMAIREFVQKVREAPLAGEGSSPETAS